MKPRYERHCTCGHLGLLHFQSSGNCEKCACTWFKDSTLQAHGGDRDPFAEYHRRVAEAQAAGPPSSALVV